MVKLGVKNFVMITLIAILGIVMAKVIFTKYNVPAVSTLVQSV
jgi:hypothetical protein